MRLMEDWPTGRVETVHPLVRRLLAPNPSPFTFTGTQTYLVGRGDVAVIEPGPDLPEHVEALVAALSVERVAAIVCTKGEPTAASARRLEEALARIRANDDLSDEQKARITTALRSAIDRARSAR